MRRSASRSRPAGAQGALALLGLLVLAPLIAFASSCDLAVNLSNLGGGCPPTQVKIAPAPDAGTSAYCIDATEATNAQYAQFEASKFTIAQAGIPGPLDGGVGPCAAVTSTAAGGSTAGDPEFADYPVTNVNWCQAYAFCKWAGKRLCGEIGGGPLAPGNQSVAQYSQWYNACSLGGTRLYPYGNGNTFDQGACGGQAAGSSAEQVSSNRSCVGPVPGLFDMSGNVWEWTDICDSTDPGAFCHAFGGGFDSTATELACTGERNWTRTATDAANIGIRCCSDL